MPRGDLAARSALLFAALLLTDCGGGGSGETSGNPADGSAKLSWMAPTLRTDGTPLDNLAGYRIYYDTTRSGFRSQIRVDNPSAITWTVTGLSRGTWYFAMTAVDSNGLESDRTNVVSKTIP